MRTSCNGCRVLRKACSEDCSIRSCLQWIKTTESQGNATVFLAKFYGRAGLLNLIDAGPEHLRPAIFRSLMYEACGRMVDPINGSAGLLSSGGWHLCQDAVDAVLRGAPISIVQIDTALDGGGGSPVLPLRTFDIRHTPKTGDVHGVSKASRRRFKRPGTSTAAACWGGHDHESKSDKLKPDVLDFPLRRWPFSIDGSHEPASGHGPKCGGAARIRTSPSVDGVTQECTKSEETTDGSMITSHEEDPTADAGGEAELDLRLSLNLARATPLKLTGSHGAGPSSQPMRCDGTDCSDSHAAKLALRLVVRP